MQFYTDSLEHNYNRYRQLLDEEVTASTTATNPPAGNAIGSVPVTLTVGATPTPAADTDAGPG